MKVSEKEFLDKLKSLKKVNTWTAEKHLKKQELIEYVNNFDCLNFD